MNPLNAIVLIVSPSLAGALLETAGRSFLILTAAFLLAVLCRRSAAATRHFIWLAALVSLLFLPVADALAPRWSGPAWANAFLTPRRSSGTDVPVLSIKGLAKPMASQSSAAVAVSVSPKSEQAARHISFGRLIWPAWLCGVILTLVISLRQEWMLRKLEREAQPVTDPELLQSWNLVLGELEIRRKVRLLQTEAPLLPMTWGWWRPAALLPSEAIHWERQRVRLVLRHELAHVRRNDCLAQALASLVCAFYWFNPLAWIAAARMRVERERACDDLVVLLGETRPSEYAGHLLEVARQWSAAPCAALPVAKRFGLEERLRSLLDGANNHGEMSRRTAAAVTGALLAMVLVLAGCDGSNTSNQEVEQLKAKNAALEKRVNEMEKLIQPIKSQFDQQTSQRTHRQKFEQRRELDLKKYTAEQLKEAEAMIGAADRKFGSPDCIGILNLILEKFPGANRAGCALLYLAQNTTGAESEKYFMGCIEKYDDCYYGDGVQVGAYARFLLADYYNKAKESDKAELLYKEIKDNYSDAIDHQGRFLVSLIK